MTNGWTLERRQKQAQLIKQWSPWAKSTGPKTNVGKKRSACNAFKYGGTSKKMKEELKMLKQLLQKQLQCFRDLP